MIIDSHCHAWTTWPYDTSVPDPQHRGVIEQLLFEMDKEGVDRANKTLRNVTGAWVKEQKVEISDGVVVAWHVVLEVTFVLDD